MAQGRSLVGEIIKNFINSLKPRNFGAELKGKDSLGTEYYESSHIRRGRPLRWCVPLDPGDDLVEKPPEWVAWLSYRRKEAPTEEEIQLNIQKKLAIIEKARMLEKPKTKGTDELKGFDKPAFPVHEEYKLKPEK